MLFFLAVISAKSAQMPLEGICKFFVIGLWAFLADPKPSVLFLFVRSSNQSAVGTEQITERIFSSLDSDCAALE